MSSYYDRLKLSYVLSFILSGLCVDVSKSGGRVVVTVTVIAADGISLPPSVVHQ
jgi:hypothetical protein